MEDTLRYLGDGLSIAALAIIWSVTANAWKRVRADLPVPLDASGARRAGRGRALLLGPIVTTVLLLAPTLLGLAHEPGSEQNAILLFSIRALFGATAGMMHLAYVRMALGVLEREGSLDR